MVIWRPPTKTTGASVLIQSPLYSACMYIICLNAIVSLLIIIIKSITSVPMFDQFRCVIDIYNKYQIPFYFFPLYIIFFYTPVYFHIICCQCHVLYQKLFYRCLHILFSRHTYFMVVYTRLYFCNLYEL